MDNYSFIFNRLIKYILPQGLFLSLAILIKYVSSHIATFVIVSLWNLGIWHIPAIFNLVFDLAFDILLIPLLFITFNIVYLLYRLIYKQDKPAPLNLSFYILFPILVSCLFVNYLLPINYEQCLKHHLDRKEIESFKKEFFLDETLLECIYNPQTVDQTGEFRKRFSFEAYYKTNVRVAFANSNVRLPRNYKECILFEKRSNELKSALVEYNKRRDVIQDELVTVSVDHSEDSCWLTVSYPLTLNPKIREIKECGSTFSEACYISFQR